MLVTVNNGRILLEQYLLMASSAFDLRKKNAKVLLIGITYTVF